MINGIVREQDSVVTTLDDEPEVMEDHPELSDWFRVELVPPEGEKHIAFRNHQIESTFICSELNEQDLISRLAFPKEWSRVELPSPPPGSIVVAFREPVIGASPPLVAVAYAYQRPAHSR
jgi:hypothetical protein